MKTSLKKSMRNRIQLERTEVAGRHERGTTCGNIALEGEENIVINDCVFL